jgi:hypothetical protein
MVSAQSTEGHLFYFLASPNHPFLYVCNIVILEFYSKQNESFVRIVILRLWLSG